MDPGGDVKYKLASISPKSWVCYSVVEPEPVLFGRSLCKGPAPGSGSTLDKTDEILNDILFVSSHIDKRLFKKQIPVLINK